MNQELHALALPAPPEVPSAIWYALSAAAIVAFYAFYIPIAPNRTERVKIYTAPAAGLLALWLFTATMDGVSTAILPPALAFMLPAFVLGSVGHRTQMRAIWKRQAAEGKEGNAPTAAMTLQLFLSLIAFGAVGLWFLI
ncbi:hypothetical protein [Streptomyces formicae]|uniref:Uncharacterized protein n=1 Tax=Streptomyces formicae TaxID=1616117 RepID=A0ABY3WHZ3_9ACTN|nr:hypothetical protein [Streptomyces formicae]UNM10987.1 hypothetical protein J4032_05150 [Streptomyces formicae]